MTTVTIPPEHAGTRLDKALAALCTQYSRARIQALIAEGAVSCAGKPATDASAKVLEHQEYIIQEPELKASHHLAEEIPLDVVFEDKQLIVINKPAGLTVHPGAGNADGTLVNALIAHTKGTLSGIGGVERPGIVHRIDKDTSGLLVVAKTDAAHHHLSAQLAARTLKREYLALCHGQARKQTISGNIGRSPKNRQKMAVLKTGGREATTHITPLESFEYGGRIIATLVKAKLETGRTHQIRVHMAHIKCPLIGDSTYGGARKSPIPAIEHFPRQALHAQKLTLIHPHTEELMAFEAPIPLDLMNLLTSLRIVT